MMYTKGIRKIFHVEAQVSLAVVQTMAENAGFWALTFNDRIQIRVSEAEHPELDFNGWVDTCFRLTDFTDLPADYS